MEKLEHYLDQVCRSIGGPRSLRQHVRQELHEHLSDAAAEHRAAGLSEDAAMDRALEDFGGPEQLRSELEATYGCRMLPVVVDKAIEWKERTMKAKWLWVSWANLALSAVIALETILLCFIGVFILPKFKLLVQQGLLDPTALEDDRVSWLLEFTYGFREFSGEFLAWILAGAIAGMLLFEWRVKSENKTFMRMSALGSLAAGLMMMVVITTAALVVSVTLAMPPTHIMVRPWTVEQLAAVDASVSAIDQALAKEDWEAMQKEADRAAAAMSRLSVGPAVTSLTWLNGSKEPPTIEDLRANLKAAQQRLVEAQQAISSMDSARIASAMQNFQKAHAPLREAAKKASAMPK